MLLKYSALEMQVFGKIETVFKELLEHQFKLPDNSEAQVHKLSFHQLLHEEYKEKKMTY